MNSDRITLLKQFIEDEPSNPFNKYALAMEYFESAPTDSLDLLHSLLDEHPNYLPSYYKAAHLLWETEDWNKAEEIFKKGILLAKKQNDQKALRELMSAYQNFQFDRI